MFIFSECSSEDFEVEFRKSIKGIGLPFKADNVISVNQDLTQELLSRQATVDAGEEIVVEAIHEAAICALAKLTAHAIQVSLIPLHYPTCLGPTQVCATDHDREAEHAVHLRVHLFNLPPSVFLCFEIREYSQFNRLVRERNFPPLKTHLFLGG